MDKLKVRVATSFEEVENCREAWDEAVIRLGGTIHMSFGWSRTWWEFYGAGKQLRIFIGSVGERMVAIVPLYVDTIGFGPWGLRTAKLVGANIPPKAFGPPVDPPVAAKVFEFVAARLLGEDRCDLISLGPVSETQAFLKQLEGAKIGQGDQPASIVKGREGLHTVFHLPGTMDEFFERMDKDERKKRKYEMRLLGKDPSVTRDVLRAPGEVEAEFEAFARLHALQWGDKGKLGHFGSWPRGREYNLALVKAMAGVGRVRFVRILSGGEVISSQYAFVFGDTWYWELPARATDRKWNRFSLGTSGFFALVEEAIKEGRTRIEGGVAHYDYKQKLNGVEYGMEVVRVVANRLGSRMRVRLYGLLRRMLGLAYYKVWYSRVSPRLPALLKKPIWTFWLRLDF